MRALRGRTKKLIVAFHFQFSQQAAWKCEECRDSGLDQKRNCGWLPAGKKQCGRVVWARREVGVGECPVSYITARSRTWVEQFAVWKFLGGADVKQMPARDAEALCILEAEFRKEANHGE